MVWSGLSSPLENILNIKKLQKKQTVNFQLAQIPQINKGEQLVKMRDAYI